LIVALRSVPVSPKTTDAYVRPVLPAAASVLSAAGSLDGAASVPPEALPPPHPARAPMSIMDVSPSVSSFLLFIISSFFEITSLIAFGKTFLFFFPFVY
jgi:hypothetical protein